MARHPCLSDGLADAELWFSLSKTRTRVGRLDSDVLVFLSVDCTNSPRMKDVFSMRTIFDLPIWDIHGNCRRTIIRYRDRSLSRLPHIISGTAQRLPRRNTPHHTCSARTPRIMCLGESLRLQDANITDKKREKNRFLVLAAKVSDLRMGDIGEELWSTRHA